MSVVVYGCENVVLVTESVCVWVCIVGSGCMHEEVGKTLYNRDPHTGQPDIRTNLILQSLCTRGKFVLFNDASRAH